MQQRYYDPTVGRFLSVDPVTAYENPTGAFNRYWYANNNPYKFTDPDGRHSCEASLCNSVSAGITAMKKSRDTYSRSSSEYKQINAVVRSIGTKDDGQGPNYKSGSLEGETAARTDQKGTVTIDMSKVDSSTDMARNMGHEGQHDIDSAVNGAATTEEAVRATEEKAYTTEAIIANGLGVKLDPEKLGEAVDTSVKNAMDKQEPEPEK